MRSSNLLIRDFDQADPLRAEIRHTFWAAWRRAGAAFALFAASTAFTLLAQPGPPPGGGGGPGIQGDGIWVRNAGWGEGQTFDSCVGHQPGDGQYHHHATPNCLRAQLDDNIEAVRTTRNGAVYREKAAPWRHSPILGWAFDGYPIYGPYGYSEPMNPASAVQRMRSGYRLRNVTARTTLPDWSLPTHPNVPQQLSTSQYGPAINRQFPLGRYLEDFEHVAGVGDLDQYNGRFAVTPEFPQGTYAYYITIEANGTPAFPYIIGGQANGTYSGGRAQTVPSSVTERFNQEAGVSATAAAAPTLSAWLTKDAGQNAKVVSGYDPSAGPSETWPTNVPAGARVSGGVTAPNKANIQRIRYDNNDVYINANGLGSYTMGPWFDPAMTGSIFSNFPSSQGATTYRLPRTPSVASTKTTTGLGPVGFFVNGVAVFNYLDGGSYSAGQGRDLGGGIVNPSAVQVSSASGEQGPMAAGSLVTAYSIFAATLATGTEAASSANWPMSLAGASVSVRDSAGVERPATISYASPDQVNFQVPEDSATGFGTVTYTAGGSSSTAGIYILASYPNLFFTATGRPAGQVIRVRGGQQLAESIADPITLPAGDAVYLVFYGSGLGKSTNVKATIGGVDAPVYAGSQGTYAGLDQFNVQIPPNLSQRGVLDLVVTVDGRQSNKLSVELR